MYVNLRYIASQASVLPRFRARWILVLIIVALVATATSAWAACSKAERERSVDQGYLWTYVAATDGGKPIAMTISILGDSTSAVLFDPVVGRNIRLVGKISGSGNVHLENAGDPHPAISFDASFVEMDPRGIYGSKLNCEVLVGIYVSPRGKMHAVFGLEHGYPGSLDKRYLRIGASDDEIVDAAARRFVEAVESGDKDAVAKMMDYPITVNGCGDDGIVRDRHQFIECYGRIFRQGFVRAITAAHPYHMFVTRYDEAILGNGLVAFVRDGYVKRIMNWAR